MKNLQDLLDKLSDEKKDLKDIWVRDLEDLTQLQLGELKGRILAYEYICDEIRGVLKSHECEFSYKGCLICGETACEDG